MNFWKDFILLPIFFIYSLLKHFKLVKLFYRAKFFHVQTKVKLNSDEPFYGFVVFTLLDETFNNISSHPLKYGQNLMTFLPRGWHSIF